MTNQYFQVSSSQMISRSKEDHQRRPGRAQRAQPAQKFVHQAQCGLAVALRQQTVHKRSRPDRKISPDTSPPAGKPTALQRMQPYPTAQPSGCCQQSPRIGSQASQLRQVQEDECQHDHPIEDALHDDGRQRGRDGHRLPCFLRKSARSTSRPAPGRYCCPYSRWLRWGTSSAWAQILHRAEQIMPAPGAHPHCYKVNRNTGQQPGVVSPTQRISQVFQSQPAQCEV